MEKFQKYCFSVLLVIISSNISAQTSNGTIKSEDRKMLYEIYNQFLCSSQCKELEKTVLNGISKRNFSIDKKQNVTDFFGNLFNTKYKKNLHKAKIRFTEEKHNQRFIIFLKENRKNFFAENIYFKSKVSKIRNKDYLDLKKLAMKSYDDGRTMKEVYTHHFNKVYRTEIEEL